MSGRRRRSHAASGGGGGHGSGQDRWMASYMDMVTVLMCLFIVLYAISTVDQSKYEQLKLSLATGFGQEASEEIDASEGLVVVPPELEGPEAVQATSLAAAAEVESDKLEDIRERIRAGLEERGVQTRIEYTIDDRGLTVKFVGAETFFAGNSASLQPAGVTALEVIGGVLATVPNEISVEGHADVRGASYPYPTDWELSASRATGVLRFLVEQTGLQGGRVSSVGYGSSRPVPEGEADPAMNRRVDVVVLSDAPEQVRALLGDGSSGTV